MSLVLWANVMGVSIIGLFATLFLYWSSRLPLNSWRPRRTASRDYHDDRITDAVF
jgi:hypothetical protein